VVEKSKNQGVVQLPVIIGLLILSIALPASLSLVQKRQEIRKKATEPNCNCHYSFKDYIDREMEGSCQTPWTQCYRLAMGCLGSCKQVMEGGKCFLEEYFCEGLPPPGNCNCSDVYVVSPPAWYGTREDCEGYGDARGYCFPAGAFSGVKRRWENGKCVRDFYDCGVRPTPTRLPTLTPTPTRLPTVTPSTQTPTPTSCPLPPAPSGLSGFCNALGTQATVSWNTVSGATKYALRVDDITTGGWNDNCNASQGDFCLDLTSTSHTFNTVPGHTYNWWVHAVNNCGWSNALGPNFFTCVFPSLTPTPTHSPTSTPTRRPTPTISPAPCPNGENGNLNCDSRGLINETDLSLLLASWSPQGPVPSPRPGHHSADIVRDGVVNINDLNKLLTYWKTR